MSSILEQEKEAAKHERAIKSLTDDEGAAVDEVRAIFDDEFARLEQGAKVRKYLHVLVTSNVRAILRRAGGGARRKPHPPMLRGASGIDAARST
jgi:hypothetical protein